MQEDLDRLGLLPADVFEALGCAVAVLDGGGAAVAANQAWRSLPADAGGGVGEAGHDRRRSGDEDLDLVLDEGLERVLGGRTSRFDIEYEAGGRWYLLAATSLGPASSPAPSPAATSPASGTGAVVVVIDVTAQHDVREILDGTAHRDVLTRLPNRRAIRSALDAAIGRGRRRGTTVSVVFLDLNGFKAVNDGHGHEVGDEVLAAVGRRLAGTIRRDDVLGRWGGDEFVVVVEGDASVAVPSLAARLHEALSRPVAIREDGTVQLGMAVGAADVGPGETVDEVLARADEAMFQAKRSGRQLVVAPPSPPRAPG